MQTNLDFYDNQDGDEFIQYKNCEHEHKMLITINVSVHHIMQVLHITVLHLFQLWSVMPGYILCNYVVHLRTRLYNNTAMSRARCCILNVKYSNVDQVK